MKLRPRLPAPLRHRGYAIVWSGGFVSNIGTWMETVAVGVYVTQTTGQAGWTGTVAALTYVPTVLLGPFGGALADRFDRRRYLATIVGVQMLIAASLALLAGSGALSVPAVAVLMLLAGCAFSVGMPARSAMTPDLVPPKDLLAAVSLNSAQWNLGRVVGPAVAGPVIALWGVTWAFGVNAMSYCAVLVALSLIRLPPVRHDGPLPRLWGTVVDGVRAARRDQGIRTALLLMLATTFLVSPFIGLIPAMAIKVFGRDAAGVSAMVTAQGIGAVLAALSLGPLGSRFGRRRMVVGAVTVVGPLAALYGVAPTFPLAVAALLLLGGAYTWVLSGMSTICQLRAPRELRGRVASLHLIAVGGGHATGLVIQGWLGDIVGLRLVTAVTALLLLAVVVTARALRPAAIRALEAPTEPSTPTPGAPTATVPR